jgi:hypothetical protein
VIARLGLAGLLLGHALIHLGYLSPRPQATAGGPPWPFELGRSSLLAPLGFGADAGRLIGVALVVLTIAGFVLAALATVGILPTQLWPAAVAFGAVASLGVLVVFFHPWLLLGVAIDLVLLWAALAPGWSPETLGT